MSSMSRTSLLIGFLAGGWMATLVFMFALSGGNPTDGLIRDAAADDEQPNAQPQPGGIPLPPLPDPFGGNGPRPTTGGRPEVPGGRGIPNPGGGTGDSNNKAIALSSSTGSGESVVYYFDTEANRLLVYQYKGLVSGNRPLRPGDKGGLRLLAARHFDFDLKLEGYRDLSERTREQLREKWEEIYGGPDAAKGKKKGLPVKKVKVGNGG